MEVEMRHEARQVPSWLIFDVRQNTIAMNTNMPRWKRTLLTVLLIAVGMLGVVVWSESRGRALLSGASLAHARRLAEKADSQVIKQFEREVNSEASSLVTTSFCAVGILLFSFSAIIALWIPLRGEGKEGPNKAPEPTPGAVTPRATEGDLK